MTSAPTAATRPLATVEQDPRWARIVARDRNADGQFWYSVLTTGVYCRPSCPSRRCNPANVTLHATLAEARATGCRPCRRCHPDEVAAHPVHPAIATACRLIETAEETPTLDEIATAVGLSAYHFHRLFKAATGITPKAYADAHRADRLRRDIGKSRTVTDAIQAAGYGSSNRFYDDATNPLGMTPSRYRAGGIRENLRVATGASALGTVLVATSDKGIAAILIGDDADALRRDLRNRFPKAQLIDGDADHARRIATVIAFVEAPQIGLDLPLDIRGTAFQQCVWQALRAIPPGSTANYTAIAQRIGAPRAVRAVAGACAANPLAVAVPCHRVIRTDGALSGYAWGTERKRSLLDRENGASRPPRPTTR
ncbi:O6-methylguanine-DNA methyltransferase [Neoasaia chiangmaiensis NBRC 101099]|uniref:methylated-DNA--[protein]-cysteine S-methyltransferase n=1 Tax=Neoasaia chiangmaiensis TaxID=320497 RepID=A0A1U9KPW5_9PROT|nr:bifunctional DNA-binding transcriptional regulator/O6-methylguanine-DNA methyltransferase Ada [Neoasaia chiangmaiensis]AQS87837.1 6-O-methylguanine DNA methyltransferase [Neoasaia chiangmaiensis]GBR35921.1 O6-methylguanine-DNA methyltransferase [Neoasaia chiangmaiensis NBRC 101099]GEN14453.1 AraC family transcriptional regulator [Neoasaia chiangmaiensis]